MLIRWTVVVDDGTRPYGPAIQRDQRRPLALVAGDDAKIEISLINPVGGVVRLQTGDFLQLTARTCAIPPRQILTARSTPGPNGSHVLSVEANATRNLQAVRGEFDLFLVRGAARSSVIPLSEFELQAAALGNNYQ